MTAIHNTFPKVTMPGELPSTHEYHIPGINPEPWAIGPISTRTSGGKRIPFVGVNEVLKTYQEALRVEFQNMELAPHMIDVPSELEIFFWRRLDGYEFNSGAKHQRHVADTTNLVKGTEDALQGILFPNDRLNLVIRGQIIEQSATTDPGIIILHRPYDDYWPGQEFVGPSWDRLRAAANAAPDLGNWNG